MDGAAFRNDQISHLAWDDSSPATTPDKRLFKGPGSPFGVTPVFQFHIAEASNAATLLATLVPMSLVIAVKDMAGLADLYAVGVVGAIATNLGAIATDRKLTIKSWERTLMFATFLVLFRGHHSRGWLDSARFGAGAAHEKSRNPNGNSRSSARRSDDCGTGAGCSGNRW
jgi:hypothetical protein